MGGGEVTPGSCKANIKKLIAADKTLFYFQQNSIDILHISSLSLVLLNKLGCHSHF